MALETEDCTSHFHHAPLLNTKPHTSVITSHTLIKSFVQHMHKGLLPAFAHLYFIY